MKNVYVFKINDREVGIPVDVVESHPRGTKLLILSLRKVGAYEAVINVQDGTPPVQVGAEVRAGSSGVGEPSVGASGSGPEPTPGEGHQGANPDAVPQAAPANVLGDDRGGEPAPVPNPSGHPTPLRDVGKGHGGNSKRSR